MEEIKRFTRIVNRRINGSDFIYVTAKCITLAAINRTVEANVRAVGSRRMEKLMCDGGRENRCHEKMMVLFVIKKNIAERRSGGTKNHKVL